MNPADLMLLMSQLSSKKTDEAAVLTQNATEQNPLQGMLMAQLTKSNSAASTGSSGNPLQAMLMAQLANANGGNGGSAAQNPLQAMLMAKLAKANGANIAPAATPRVAAKPAESDNPLQAMLAAQLAQAGSVPAAQSTTAPNLDEMLGTLRKQPDGLRLLRQRLQSMIAFVDAQLAADGHDLTEQELSEEEARLQNEFLRIRALRR